MLDLKKISQQLPKLEFKNDSESLQTYGKDWTPYFKPQPIAVVFPKTTEDVRDLVQFAVKEKIALVPSGGRTGLSGGAVALNFEIIVSFDKMNQILNFDSTTSSVRCQAGVITEALQKFAESKNLYYPVDFAAKGSSQIGGNVATNAGGIKVIKYGMTRNWIIGLKVVTGTGEILELNNGLTKNATGYDFRHLFIGSEGTLGFITEVLVQLAPPPPPLFVSVLGLPNLESVMKVFSEIKSKHSLTAFELFSDLALAKVLASTGLSKPFETNSKFYVVAEIEAPTENEKDKFLETFSNLAESGIVEDGAIAQSDVQGKNFWRLREDISESLSKFSPYKNDISVPIPSVPQFMTDLDQILMKAYPDFEVIWFGHIGDGNLHINILKPENLSKPEFLEKCRTVDQFVFEAVRKFKGAISAEHGVGLTKKAYLHYSRSAAEIELMRGIKKVFDPAGIINPGKIF